MSNGKIVKLKSLLVVVSFVLFASQICLAGTGRLVSDVSATASSSIYKNVSVMVDGSGLGANGLLHTDNYLDMWCGLAGGGKANPGTSAGPAWVRLDLGSIYELDKMFIWNMNEKGSDRKNGKLVRFIERGLKNVAIEYSTSGGSDKSEWTKLGDFLFAQGTGQSDYGHNSEVDFGKIKARYIVITPHESDGNWGSGLPDQGDFPVGKYALAEVRFFGDSLFALKPVPAHGQKGVSAEMFLSWQPLSKAVAHDVYLGTSRSAVSAATRSGHAKTQYYAEALAESSYKLPTLLTPDTRYYWRIDSVNGAGAVEKSLSIWTFKTGSKTAYDPLPRNNKKGLGRLLKWSKGCYSLDGDSQDVYLGTSYDEIKNADSSSSAYMGRQSAVVYASGGFNNGAGLELGKTYYWRVDQVGKERVEKGAVWGFTSRYRVIFNSDGFAVLEGAKRGSAKDTMKKWIENLFLPLEDNHVDLITWCDGSGGNTAKYESEVLEEWGLRVGKTDPIIRKWIAEGNDPPKVVIREAHKRGLDAYYAFRINDIHDAFTPEEYPTFKEEHPEWMIGKGQPYGYHTALDFTYPEVRQIKFDTIKEAFDKYDFDGLEVDFMRGPPFFIPGTEPQNAHILTEHLRRIRNHLNARGKERGRPIRVIARVDENLNACALDGFDVETWIKDGLVDIIMPGSGAVDIAVEDFKALTKGTDVLIYPCLYGNRVSTKNGRGTATNYWYQGADGIYTYNWYAHSSFFMVGLHNEIGDPDALVGKDKEFLADKGKPHVEYPHNWMNLPLPAELAAGRTVEVPILVGDDLTGGLVPEKVELIIVLEQFDEGDKVTVLFNRKPLVETPIVGNYLIVPLKPGQVIQGRNKVIVQAIKGDVRVSSMKIGVSY